MCPACKKAKRLLSRPVAFTLAVSVGLLVWLSVLFSAGALLLQANLLTPIFHIF